MKKLFATLSIAVLIIALTAACQPSKDKAEKMDTESADTTSVEQTAHVMYTCSMHPEVMKDEPGKCPKCGMELVKKEMTDEEMKKMEMDTMKHE
jgi:uncharacterized protein with PIN domain